jgi:hypothetical protein
LAHKWASTVSKDATPYLATHFAASAYPSVVVVVVETEVVVVVTVPVVCVIVVTVAV